MRRIGKYFSYLKLGSTIAKAHKEKMQDSVSRFGEILAQIGVKYLGNYLWVYFVFGDIFILFGQIVIPICKCSLL